MPSARDIAFLGKELVPMVADGRAGATRLITLLSWMRGEGIEQQLTWEQVVEICQQIEGQLEGPEDAAQITGNNSRMLMASLVAVVAVIIVLISAIMSCPSNKMKLPPRSILPEAVLIPAERYVVVDGSRKEMAEFLVSAHEVTIGEYAEFMEILASLAKGGRHTVFDHKEQPEEKASHAPDDWQTMIRAAKSGEFWKGRIVTLDSPVVGVDWWDCVGGHEPVNHIVQNQRNCSLCTVRFETLD